MRISNKKQIAVIFSFFFLFTASTFFVYLKSLRIEMFAEAGFVAGAVVKAEREYFELRGGFAAVEEGSGSPALSVDLKANKYFTLMSIKSEGDALKLRSECSEGFFKGTELYVSYNIHSGVTGYEIREKTKIPLPLS